MKRRISILITVIFGLVVSLCACQGKNDNQAMQHEKKLLVITAIKKPYVTHLYFDGTLKPIKTTAVLSPVNGRIDQLNFHYGQRVKAGEKLLVIHSPKLADSYRKAVTDFLQSKQKFIRSAQSFQGEQALYDAKVISRDEYLQAKDAHQDDVLNYYQSKFNLEKILDRARIDKKAIEQLTIADTSSVNKILQQHFRELPVYAPASGIALFPFHASGNKTEKLSVGVDVKLGQRLLSIGDLQGLSIDVQVSEININQIKPGMKISVTGEAFPGQTLHGYIDSVSAQAKASQGMRNAFSTFLVRVIIPKISEQQLKTVRIGMSAKITLNINNPPAIILPIAAVKTDHHHNTVTIVTATGEHKTVSVQVGATTPTGVVIQHGIKPGTKVVVHAH